MVIAYRMHRYYFEIGMRSNEGSLCHPKMLETVGLAVPGMAIKPGLKIHATFHRTLSAIVQ